MPLALQGPTPYCNKTICKEPTDSQGNPIGGALICSPDTDPSSLSQCSYVGGNCHGDFCTPPNGTEDEDYDGYDSSVDCNDNEPAINPGVSENCGDNVDNNCDVVKDCEDPSCMFDNLCTGCSEHYESCNGGGVTCCNQMVCRGGQCVDENECNPACTGEQVCVDGYCGVTPILVDVSGNGFKLTDAAGGINFNFEGNGIYVRLPWTKAKTDDAWLALDRDGNGMIDRGAELFGSSTAQPPPPPGYPKNGFLALAEFDLKANGGNLDGRISPKDAIFTSLKLWQDKNHNGISEASELHSLRQLGIVTMDLDYKESKRTDQYGNMFKYRAKVKDASGAQAGRWAYDVFLKL